MRFKISSGLTGKTSCSIFAFRSKSNFKLIKVDLKLSWLRFPLLMTYLFSGLDLWGHVEVNVKTACRIIKANIIFMILPRMYLVRHWLSESFFSFPLYLLHQVYNSHSYVIYLYYVSSVLSVRKAWEATKN